ncbi:hypothetical protein EAH76_11880 [Sphingomonas glacialis]|uniref:Uncharacterized protein n=1 Tax=Sphingomonas glacialis TaxID=658225 RepID=A0A502FT75_9SPHN|nr:hypothetical protein EAH76_11880 [Sphingomonas glacialis]
MLIVLSGTDRHVLSGTQESSYREPECARNPQKSARNWHPSNGANREESFGFLLTPQRLVDERGTRRHERRCRAAVAVPPKTRAGGTGEHAISMPSGVAGVTQVCIAHAVSVQIGCASRALYAASGDAS